LLGVPKKKNELKLKNAIWSELNNCSLAPGVSSSRWVKVMKQKGTGFNVAGKW